MLRYNSIKLSSLSDPKFIPIATSMPNNVPTPGEMVVPTATPILALANIDTAPLCLSHHKYNTSW